MEEISELMTLTLNKVLECVWTVKTFIVLLNGIIIKLNYLRQLETKGFIEDIINSMSVSVSYLY